MSNRQLEEQAEARRNAWLARKLGVDVDQLTDLDLSIEEITGNDDMYYGYRAIIGPEADRELVEERLGGRRSIDLGFVPDDGDGEPLDRGG